MTDQPFHQPYPPYPSQSIPPGQGHPGEGYYPPGHQAVPARPDDPTAVVGRRVGQYLLDGLLSAIPLLVLYAAMAVWLFVKMAQLAPTGGGYGYSTTDPGQVSGILAGFYGVCAVLMLVGAAVGWSVFAWWPHRHQGRTPAMGWLGLRIVSADTGGQPTLGALSLRWLLLMVDGAFAGLVGLIVMSNNPRHQRLGDMAASTVVVRTR